MSSLHVFWSEFSCKQAVLSFLRSFCNFCFPDPNYRPTTSQHVSTGFATTKICLSTTIRLDPCLPIMLFGISVSCPSSSLNKQESGILWKLEQTSCFFIGNFCWFDFWMPQKKRTTNIQNIQPTKSRPDVAQEVSAFRWLTGSKPWWSMMTL